MKRTVSLATALLAVVLFALHAAASLGGWYETYPYFDRYMHFLGGAFVFSGILFYVLRRRKRPFPYGMLFTLSMTVGILWEGYEYAVQHYTGASLATIPDSLDDLVLDFLGVCAAALFYSFVHSRKKRYNTSNAGQ